MGGYKLIVEDEAVLLAGRLRLDRRIGAATLGDDVVELQRTETRLLALLMAESGQVVATARLLSAVDVGGRGRTVARPARLVYMHMSRLAGRLYDGFGDRVEIENVYGVGYRQLSSRRGRPGVPTPRRRTPPAGSSRRPRRTRRRRMTPASSWAGALSFDMGPRRASCRGSEVKLSERESQVLVTLVRGGWIQKRRQGWTGTRRSSWRVCSGTRLGSHGSRHRWPAG